MKFVVALMILVFGVVGVKLAWVGVRDFVARMRARERLLRREGVILRFEVREMMRSTHRRRKGVIRIGGPAQRIVRYAYPVISFTKADGTSETFQSPIGENADRNPHSVGHTIPVKYDPRGELPPMLDSWAGLWLAPIAMTFAGLVFTAAAIGISAVFGSRILGT